MDQICDVTAFLKVITYSFWCMWEFLKVWQFSKRSSDLAMVPLKPKTLHFKILFPNDRKSSVKVKQRHS